MSGAGWRIAGAFALGALAATACADPPDDAGSAEPWASVAVEQFDHITAAFCGESDYEVASHFAAGGSLDLRMWPGGPIATTVEEIASTTDQFFSDGSGDRLEVWLDDLYLHDDGAIGVYRDAADGELRSSWAIVYAVDGPRMAARAFRTGDLVIGSAPVWDPLYDRAEELYERYLDAWSSGDEAAVAAVYVADAVVVDGLAGTVASGRDAIAEEIGRTPPLQPGPETRLFTYDVDGWREVVAIVQTGGQCPMREAHRWILRDERIVEDVRSRHVPSVRRCGVDLPDGWWADFEPATGELRVSNLATVVDGAVIEIVNAELEQVDFVRWLFERYAAGLDRPDVRAIWFPPSVDCPGHASFARRHDARFEGGHSVTFCLSDRELGPWSGKARWTPRAARVGLHELAHVWLYDHLTERDRVAFGERADLKTWRDRGREWGELGVEHAAETIAWGLSGDEYATYEVVPRPSCRELTARFELLTGRRPLTACSADRGG